MTQHERIAQCTRAIRLLDGMGRDSEPSSIGDARAVYDELLSRQQAQYSADLQEPLDRLKARLRFFGQRI